MNNKLGTCCQILDDNGVQYKDTIIGTVQQSSLDKLVAQGKFADHKVVTTNPAVRVSILTDDKQAFKRCHDKVVSKVKQNLNALYTQLQHVSRMPTDCHMFRISSNLLPMFDHPQYNVLYNDYLLKIVQAGLARCKKLIDEYSIIVTCHPDQYNKICSDKDHVRANTFRTLEYHRYFMEQLTTLDKSCINVHCDGALDHCPELDQGMYQDLCKWLSIENDAVNTSAGVLDTLSFCNKYNLKMVYDLHHDFCENSGTGHTADDDRIMASIVNTWQGQTPIFHVSASRDPEGDTPKKLNPHSDYINCDKVIERTKELLEFANIELEAKAKNLAISRLYKNINNI